MGEVEAGCAAGNRPLLDGCPLHPGRPSVFHILRSLKVPLTLLGCSVHSPLHRAFGVPKKDAAPVPCSSRI